MEQSTPDAVSTALEQILRDDFDIDGSSVSGDSRLIDDVGSDSVAFAVGMVAIEDKLGAAMTEQEPLSCDTVRDQETAIRAEIPPSERAGSRPVPGDERVIPRLGGH